MLVGKVCERNVDEVQPDETVWDAAKRMHQRGVGSLVVVNLAREPIGIVTDRDLVARVLAKNADPDSTMIRHVMTAPVETVQEDAPYESVIMQLSRCEIRRLPVVDREGELVGIISLDDIVGRMAEHFLEIRHVLKRQTPRAAASL